MTNWISIAVLFSSGTQTTMAQMKAGGSVEHKLSCRPTDSKNIVLGVGYKMVCSTAALAPQYSLRSCDLYETAVVPNAQPRLISLEEKKQTATSALLVNKYEKIKVKVKKYPLVAQVQISNGYELTCSEKLKGPIGGGMSAGN